MIEIDSELKFNQTKSHKRQISALKKRMINNKVGTNITMVTRALKALQLKEKEKENDYVHSGGLPPGMFNIFIFLICSKSFFSRFLKLFSSYVIKDMQ